MQHCSLLEKSCSKLRWYILISSSAQFHIKLMDNLSLEVCHLEMQIGVQMSLGGHEWE